MMFTRRVFGLTSLVLIPIGLLRTTWAQSDETFTVRVRADEQARSVLPPIAMHNLSVEPDGSEAARDLAARAPAERAAPVEAYPVVPESPI
jgi:hypothetical protein